MRRPFVVVALTIASHIALFDSVTAQAPALAQAQTPTAPATDQYVIGPDSKPQAGVPKGKVTPAQIVSKVYGDRTFNYQVYVPAQYDGSIAAAVMVFQDGNNYVREPGAWHIPVVFDNLIHKKEMPVTIGIFIDPSSQQQRAQEYDTLSDMYARFVVEEVLPEVGKTYNLTKDPEGRAIAGFSSGAICAFTVAWERPDEFRKVVSCFGSFTSIAYRPARDGQPMQPGGDLYPTLIRKNPIKPLKIFIQDGSNDLNNQFGSWYLANRQMAAALEWANANADQKKIEGPRYSIETAWGDGGHTANQGASIFPDIMRWMWKGYEPKVQAPAIGGALPGGPVFDSNRPKPTAGNVLDIESLTTPPEGFTMQRRNNFYKPDGSDGLYRWAASGHWSNYDESKTGDWRKSVPDVMKMANGEMVKDADTWRNVRRPEIVKLLETNMYGRIPDNLPKIQWTATKTTNADGSVTTVATGTYVNTDGTPFANPGARGGAPAAPVAPTAPTAAQPSDAAAQAAQVAAPAADAAPAGRAGRGGRGGRGGFGGGGNGLTVTYTVPANAQGAVPLIQGGDAQQVFAMGFGTVIFGGQAPNVTSQPPAPDDWGAIRKYGWVVSRCLDYLESDKSVDAHQVSLTGHSIGGKQALVAGAFDEHIGLVFASCSGEGGASMMRHDWGETIDDIAQLSPLNYCENFQKWVSHWDKNPVDAHMLVALMAPRPLMITGGSTDQWSDPVGVFWSGYYGSPAYEVLGKFGLGVSAPPKLNTFLEGNLVYYHHIGGHTPMPAEREKYHEMMRKYFKVKPVTTQ